MRKNDLAGTVVPRGRHRWCYCDVLFSVVFLETCATFVPLLIAYSTVPAPARGNHEIPRFHEGFRLVKWLRMLDSNQAIC